MPRAAALPRVGREQLDQVPLLLGDPPADRGELERADRARRGGRRAWPMQPMPHCRVFCDQPPVQRVAVDGAAAGRFVGGDELVDRCRGRRPRAARRTATPSRTATRGPRAGRRGARAPSRSTAARPCSSTITLPEPQVAVDDRRRGARAAGCATQPGVAPSRTSGCVVDAARSSAQTASTESASLGARAPRRGRSRGGRRGTRRGRRRACSRARRRTRRRAGSGAAIVSPGDAAHHEPGGAEQRRRRRRPAPRARAGRRAGTRASRRPRSRIEPGSPGRPGGSRRRISARPSAVNDHVSRDAPPVSRCSPSISTGAEDRREHGREPLRYRRWFRRGRHRRSGRGTPRGRRRRGRRTSSGSCPR